MVECFIIVDWCVGSFLMVVGLGFVAGLSGCVYRCYLRRRTAKDGAVWGNGRQRAPYLQSVVTSGMPSDPITSGPASQSEAVKDALRMRIMPPEVFKSAVSARLSGKTQLELTAEPEVKNPQFIQLSGKLDVGECARKGSTCEKMSIQVVGCPKYGTLEFSVGYDRNSSALSVTIICARHLASVGRTNLSPPSTTDPYVKLQLLPDRRLKAKTRIAKRTLEPIFDETFTFYGLTYESLSSVTIHMAVLGFDRFSRDDVIGDVIFPLHKLNLDGKTLTFVRALNRRDQSVRTNCTINSFCSWR